ncbi:hypothetical protein GCM10007981_10090 [Thermocladium modestius]|uniref:Uncharacterized protein n=1 Tax=Thermocladium modestius TaxID=62609 RepID=A0A830GW10_9CREN|nr:hypothetical protein [Thermocladium modestius]GGP20750.1 hypothetical protein GCM10007981_10090 [Thermocladium modestius]
MSVYFEGLVEDRLYLFAFSSTSFMMKDITEERRFKRRLILSIVVGLVLVIAAAAYVLALYALNKGPSAPSPLEQDGPLLGSIGAMAALVFYSLSKRPNVDYSAPDYETSYRYVRVIGYPNDGLLSISIDTSQGTYEYQVKVGKRALGIIRELAENPTWRTRVYSY